MDLTLGQEILNATSDGSESLDQVYLMVRFEVHSQADESSGQLTLSRRERNPSITLAEVVSTIIELARQGLLKVRTETCSDCQEPSCEDVVSGWMQLTPVGRRQLEELA